MSELVCNDGRFVIPKLKRVADSPTRPDFSSKVTGSGKLAKSKSSLTSIKASPAPAVVVSTKTQSSPRKAQQHQPQPIYAHSRSKSCMPPAKSQSSLKKTSSKETKDDIKLRPTSKRDNIVFEVLTTERTYVGLLKITIDEFFGPLKKTNPPLIPEAQLAKIFSILEDIYLTNSKLLEDLEKRMDAWNPATQKIGDLFCTFAPFLKMYALYVSNYDDATTILETYEKVPAVKTWLSDKCHDPNVNVLSLQSLLILPVQRIPRYCLLLKDLVKNTPEYHPDFLDLQSSLKVILEIADQINEDVKRRENRQKLLKLQASLTSFTAGFNVSINTFLFRTSYNIFLLVCLFVCLLFGYNDFLLFYSSLYQVGNMSKMESFGKCVEKRQRNACSIFLAIYSSTPAFFPRQECLFTE